MNIMNNANTVLKIAHLMSGGAGHRIQMNLIPNQSYVLCHDPSLDLKLLYEMDLSIPKKKQLKLLKCLKDNIMVSPTCFHGIKGSL